MHNALCLVISGDLKLIVMVKLREKGCKVDEIETMLMMLMMIKG